MMVLSRDVLWIVTVVNRINHKLIIIMIPFGKMSVSFLFLIVRNISSPTLIFFSSSKLDVC